MLLSIVLNILWYLKNWPSSDENQSLRQTLGSLDLAIFCHVRNAAEQVRLEVELSFQSVGCARSRSFTQFYGI